VVVQNATLHDLCMAPSETFPRAFRVYSSWTVLFKFIVKTFPRTLICSTKRYDRFDTAQRAATNLSSASCRCLSAHVDRLHATCGGALPGTRATTDQRSAQAQEAWRYGLAHLARRHTTMTDSCTKDTETLERTSHTC
jgi:hypothetical protein